MANYNIYVLLSATGTFGPSNRQQNITVGDTLTVTVSNYISGYRGWNAYISSGWTSGGTFTPMPAAWTGLYSNGPIVFTSTGAGSGAYQISLYARLPYYPYTYRSGRIYGQVAAAPASYSLSAPTSIQEGTTGTITATASNHTYGIYYWSVTPSADFTTNQGATYLASSGSSTFTVTPTADGVTEGSETATVRLFTDSARTAQVASTTFTITDAASSGGGGGSTGGGTSGGSTNQGINVFSPNGTKVFGTDLRTQNIQYSYQESVGAGSTSTTKTMADANNTGKVLIVILGYYQPGDYTINTSSTGFNITNNTGGTRTIDVLALRIG